MSDHKKQPTILQLLPSLQSGGVERGTVEIAKGLVEKGFGSIVASSPGPMTRQIEEVGATWIPLPLLSKNIWTAYKNVERIGRIIAEHQVDIVHARSRMPAWSGFYAAQKAGCHFVTTFHGVHSHGSALKRAYNRIMVKGEKTIVGSYFMQHHAHHIYHLPFEQIEFIPRGVDIDYFDPAHVETARVDAIRAQCPWTGMNQRRVILLPGRLTSWKGHLPLIEALAQLPKASFYALFVGDDKHHSHYRQRIDQAIQRHGLQDQVAILKHAHDMPALYALSDIVVSASTRPEAFGRVAVEAQAMERLVIATAHGGSLDTIVPEKTGWLVPPADTNAMITALNEAIQCSNTKQQEIGQHARQHMTQHFTTQLMVDRTLELYQTLIEDSTHDQ